MKFIGWRVKILVSEMALITNFIKGSYHSSFFFTYLKIKKTKQLTSLTRRQLMWPSKKSWHIGFIVFLILDFKV